MAPYRDSSSCMCSMHAMCCHTVPQHNLQQRHACNACELCFIVGLVPGCASTAHDCGTAAAAAAVETPTLPLAHAGAVLLPQIQRQRPGGPLTCPKTCVCKCKCPLSALHRLLAAPAQQKAAEAAELSGLAQPRALHCRASRATLRCCTC